MHSYLIGTSNGWSLIVSISTLPSANEVAKLLKAFVNIFVSLVKVELTAIIINNVCNMGTTDWSLPAISLSLIITYLDALHCPDCEHRLCRPVMPSSFLSRLWRRESSGERWMLLLFFTVLYCCWEEHLCPHLIDSIHVCIISGRINWIHSYLP